MTYERPEVNDEELGMRAAAVRRAKAVERAIELLRHALGAAWGELDIDAIHEVEFSLGEVWTYVSRPEWDALRFGSLTLSDALKLADAAGHLRSDSHDHAETMSTLVALLQGAQPVE